MTRRQLAGLLITVAGLASIAVATLTPVSALSERSPWWCVTCGSIVMADGIVNVALFIPAGVGLALLSRRTVAAIVMLALASVAVELAQAFAIAGRDAALRDVLANALGAAVGVEVVRKWRQWLVPEPTRAVWLSFAAAVVWLVTLGTTVALARPSAPLDVYWGQRGVPPEFSGSVVRVALNGAEVPLGVLDFPPLLAAFSADEPRVDVEFVPGAQSDVSQPIARISNPRTELFRLSQRGHDLIFGIRTRAADVGLRSPLVRLGDAIEPSADRSNGSSPDTVAVFGRLRRGVLSLDRRSGTPLHGALRITPATGWVYFAPSAIVIGVAPWIVDGLWVAALLFPVGYWGAAAVGDGSGQHRRGPRRWLGPVLAVAIGGPLALVARITNAPPPAWTTWCFAVAGLMTGVIALRWVRAAASGVRSGAAPR